MPTDQTRPEQPKVDQTKIVGRLPGFEIEIIHRAPQGDMGEAIGVMLRAADTPLLPPFAANPLLANPIAWNPFLVWAELTAAAWQAWFGAFALAPPRRER